MSEKVGVVRSTSLEKDRVSVEENVGGPPKQLAYGGDDKLPPPPTLTAEEEKRLWRKIDMRILPILTLMYLCSFLDRGNIGNAKLQGLTTQLNLTGDKYNIALTMYFIPYCIFECPANFLLKKFRPSRWLPGITLLWGVIMTLMGLVKNYPQLVGTRVLLGVAEAGLFPGVVYYLSLWYPRHKLQYRIGLFYGGASLAGAFSGLLAFAISFMSGTAGLLGWSWIFILEGILTVIVGFVAFFVLVDFPHTATFLTLEERAWVVHRKKYDNSSVGEEEHFEYRHIRETLLDWQIWLHILLYMSIVAPGKCPAFQIYGISLFLPSIINGFGFSTAISQLLTVPAYLLATIGVITCAYWSDKLQIRWPFVLAGLITCMVGFGINVANVPIGVKYFGTFLCVIGGYSSFPGIVAWLGNNLAGHYKRGLGMALHIGIGNFSGAIASNVYRSGDAPRYILGHSLEMMFVAIGLITLPIIVISYKRINAQRDAAMKEADERGIKYSPEELRRLGDRAPDFRYTI